MHAPPPPRPGEEVKQEIREMDEAGDYPLVADWILDEVSPYFCEVREIRGEERCSTESGQSSSRWDWLFFWRE